jgi:GntR family carbon starvation induced transcriptional regulator
VGFCSGDGVRYFASIPAVLERQENAVTDASVGPRPQVQRAATLSDQVFRRLEDDILNCRLVPGSKLRQKELGATYGTAGSAVREALSQLASMGLVVAEPQRGFRVADASIDDLIDLTMSRIWVESIALRSAMSNGGREWEASIIAAVHMLGEEQPKRIVTGARPARSTDPVDDDWRVLHQSFHNALVGACGLKSLLNYRSKLIVLSDRYRRLSSIVPSDRNVAEEHDALAQAVLARDADRAVELIEAHFLETAARVLAGSSNFKGNLSETMERLRLQIRAGDGRSGKLNGGRSQSPAGKPRAAPRQRR